MDHAFHECLRQKRAGRYMDDGYVFCSSRDLPRIRELFLTCLESLGLQPNAKACFSSCLNRELTFLKIRFSCADDRPRRRLARVTLIRYRRHLKSLCSSVGSGKLSPEVVAASVASFKGVLSVSTARHRYALESKVCDVHTPTFSENRQLSSPHFGHSRTMSQNSPKMSETVPRCPQMITVHR